MEKIALVTGAERGIGRVIAVELSTMGYQIAVNFLDNNEAADETCRLIAQNGGRAVAFKTNVGKFEQVSNMFEAIEKEMGASPLILVNNAGITKDNLLMRMKEDEWSSVIQVNLNSVYYCTHEAIRGMLKAKWGRIINIASVVGLIGSPGQSNYCASKAGVIGFTKSVAREYGSKGVTANAVAPGFIDTAMTSILKDELKASFISQIPAGRIGTAGDVAKAVGFFASESSSYISGQVLAVDGGMTMC
ncbi:MAG: 3-oxoacyl-[acyl-carrier-protein] reductase [Synergistaceae bacterium]|nr:3-oxoacyl-[acyl-carrier-protein] reductase [Synergistaceae bacterium]